MTQSSRRPLKVGLYIPNGDGYMSGSINHWTDILAMARAAEEAGFDSVWVADHLIFRFESDKETQSRWECWSLLGGIAAATTRVEIGPLVSCMSFRNPGLLAKIAETVDDMSNGRLILAVGAGWHEPEYTSFGIPYDHRASRFEEGFAVLYDLMRTGKSDFKGTYYQTDRAELKPRGPRVNQIPLMIGTNGKRLLKLAAKYGDSWNTTWIGDVKELGPLMKQVDIACAEVGREPKSLERTACIYLDAEDHVGRGVRPDEHYDFPPARSAEGNAQVLRDYADAGLSHVMLWLDPNTPRGVTEFGKVLEILDREM